MATTKRHPTESALFRALTSQVGKKLLTGITGLGLTLFVILHMLGNLSYFSGDDGAYNKYSDFLLGTGPLLYLLEIVLLVAFLLHAYLGIVIYLGKRRARKVGYSKYVSRGEPSLQSASSRTMIFTGIVLSVFLVIHLASFKFGPGIDEGYVANELGVAGDVATDEAKIGQETVETVGNVVVMRDLKRLVTERFQSPFYTFGYMAVMILLGFHLRHGIWSAFQSLGAMSPRARPIVYAIGGLLALGIAVGFLVLPLYIYFFVPDPGVVPAP